ncbi:MAG: hypothetical protein IJ343_10965 [Clostridia bacterium]|nr:hypothetical protein [Clostridia bacterium]
MREKMELKTNRLAVLLTTAWPMVIALVVMVAGTLVILPWEMALQIGGIMLGIVLLTLAICVPMYIGVYLFLPASEVKGARLLARLGRNETEIANISAGELLVKQNFIEKALKVCHIRQKGTAIYLRGVPEVERVKEWIAANFPEKTVTQRSVEMQNSKKKKKNK